jgi:hypothetical protein
VEILLGQQFVEERAVGVVVHELVASHGTGRIERQPLVVELRRQCLSSSAASASRGEQEYPVAGVSITRRLWARARRTASGG